MEIIEKIYLAKMLLLFSTSLWDAEMNIVMIDFLNFKFPSFSRFEEYLSLMFCSDLLPEFWKEKHSAFQASHYYHNLRNIFLYV